MANEQTLLSFVKDSLAKGLLQTNNGRVQLILNTIVF